MRKDAIQNTIQSWSERLFPGLSDVDSGFLTHRAVFVYDIKSTLLLQMALDFNLVYLPVWLLTNVASYINKCFCYGWFTNLLLGMALTALSMVEFVRLYLGMDGNLSEKTTQLSSFWFTTLLIELPLMAVYMIVALSTGQILEMCTSSVLVALVAVQMAVSFAALRNVARHRNLWKHYPSS